MSGIVPVLLSNAVFAAGMSLLVIVLTKFWRSPQLAHALWGLVLLKLITPPFAGVPVPEVWLRPFSSSQDFESDVDASAMAPSASTAIVSPRTPVATTVAPTVDFSELEHGADGIAFGASRDVVLESPPVTVTESDSVTESECVPTARWEVVGVIWMIGTVLVVCLMAWRCFRFRRLLLAAEDADSEVAATVAELSKTLGLRRCPPVRTVMAPIPPLVWCLGWRPVVLLPLSLLRALEPAQRRAVIAHELAHIRRGDHLVRWLEVLTSAAFWWYPVVWLARRRLRQAEEECCDAWVVWAMPAERRSYGQAMLKTIEFLTDGPTVPTLAGSAFGRSYYQRRFEMIMQQDRNRKASRTALFTAGLLAVIVLPLTAQTEKELGKQGASQGSLDLFESNLTPATESSWELGLEVSRPAGQRTTQLSVKQQAIATQQRALAALHQLADEELSQVDAEPASSTDTDKLKELRDELDRVQRQINAFTAAQQPADDAKPDGLKFIDPLGREGQADAIVTPPLEAVWEHIVKLEVLLKDLRKAQAEGFKGAVAPIEAAAADSTLTIRDRINSEAAALPRLPSFEVSSHEEEQQLQERLLQLDVESAKRGIAAAQRNVERLARLGDAVSAKELDEQRDALIEKEIQLQRAETVLELFRLQAKREREQAKRREDLRRKFSQFTMDEGPAPPEKTVFSAPQGDRRLVRVRLIDANSKPIPQVTLTLDGTRKGSHYLRRSGQTDKEGRIDFAHASPSDEFELSLRLNDSASFQFVDETVPLSNLGEAQIVDIIVRYDGKQAQVVGVTKPEFAPIPDSF